MQPLERLVNLVALLLDSRRPLTFEEIRERMPGAYEQTDLDTAKRMFERDKDILRDIGIPVEVVATDVWDAEQGYTIPKDDYYLPEIAFTAEEISALFVAARTGGQETSAEEAVRKLLYGAEGGILAGSTGVPMSPDGGPTDARLTAAAEAIAERRRVRFDYRTARGEASERHVDPYGLVFRGGHWYLVGMDRDRGDLRAFRVSRLVSELEDEGDGGSPPHGFRAADHVQPGPWPPGEQHDRARVALSPDVAWIAARSVADVETLVTRDDGWVEIALPAGEPAWIASWVLSYGPDAEVLEPAALRVEVFRRLEAMIAGA
jgi:proteasome accessory factor B